MQEQLPRDVFAERIWMYSQRVLGETPGYRRIPNEVRPLQITFKLPL
jgi:hypothetical protein